MGWGDDVLLLWRAECRRAWRGLVLVGLVVSLVGTVVLASLAGARRTESSFARFVTATRTQDMLVFASDARPADVAALRALPGVEGIGYIRPFVLQTGDGGFIAAGGALDDVLFRDVGRTRIVAGRETDPEAIDEVVIGEALAERTGLTVGDVLPLQGFAQAEIDDVIEGGGPPAPTVPRLSLRVVGVSRSPVDLSLQGSDGGILLLSRAFTEEYDGRLGGFLGPQGAVLYVRLTEGSDRADWFLTQLRTVLGNRGFEVDPTALGTGGVQESIDLLAMAILVLGLTTGVAGLVALALIVSRQTAGAAHHQRPVRDLGLTRRRRAAAAGGPALAATLAGVVLAIPGAWLASGLFPFGVAGAAEPHPGRDIDELALGTGAFGCALLLGVAVAVAAARAVRPAPPVLPAPPSAIVRATDILRLGPSASIGARLALASDRGPSTVPARSSLLASGLAILGVVAALVFGASLTGLAHDEAAFGQPWHVRIVDTQASTPRSGGSCGAVRTRLSADPDVAALASLCNLNVTVDGRAVGGYALARVKGRIGPTIVRGRAPRRADEIALGSTTLDRLGRDLGDQVTGRATTSAADYTVVGVAVVPTTGDPQAVADGAIFTPAGLDRIDVRGDGRGQAVLVARFRDGVDPVQAAERIRSLPGIGDDFEAGGVTLTTPPLEVERLRQIDRTPPILAAATSLCSRRSVSRRDRSLPPSRARRRSWLSSRRSSVPFPAFSPGPRCGGRPPAGWACSPSCTCRRPPSSGWSRAPSSSPTWLRSSLPSGLPAPAPRS